MTKKEKTIAKILRGEVSACEAYDQAIEKIEDFPERSTLAKIRNDHHEAANFWKAQANIQRVDQDKDSGAWGSVVKSFVGASKLFGDNATLKAIKEGEEHGLSNYEDMLENEEVTIAQKQKIRTYFIPRQQNHISTLNSMMS